LPTIIPAIPLSRALGRVRKIFYPLAVLTYSCIVNELNESPGLHAVSARSPTASAYHPYLIRATQGFGGGLAA
jgi:hypothetical protein